MFLLLVAAVLLLLFCPLARACTTVVIGKSVSSTGHVIVGHNEDDSGRVVNRHGYVPAAVHAEGETLPAEPGCAAIPQIRRTHGFYWSEMKKAEGGLSTADAFYNDQGVLIVSDSCADSKESLDDSRVCEGGIMFNLRRVMAERASSAREAVEIAAKLLDRYGYAGSGRCYTAADADEAWMLQVIHGKHYAARRVRDDEAALIPNYYTIHDVDPEDHENFILSPGLIEYAVERGWYDPAEGAFDFTRAFQAEKTRLSAGNRLRSFGGYSILTRRPFWCEDDYPFAVTPRQAIPAEQVMEVLRSHYDGTSLDPEWARAKFSGGAPHDTNIRRICTGTTLESFVMVFGAREHPDTAAMWLAQGRPCELPYIPIHPYFGVPSALDAMGGGAAELLRDHLLPDAELASWRDCGWRRAQDFQNLFELLYQEHEREHSRWLWSFENALARDEETLQAEIAAAGGDDFEKTRALVKIADEKAARETLSALEEIGKDLPAVPVTAEPAAAPIKSGHLIKISFELDAGRCAVENSLQITLGGTNARLSAIRPIRGSLKRTGRKWSFRVAADDLQKAGVPGTFDYWLGGRDRRASSFGGRFFFTFAK